MPGNPRLTDRESQVADPYTSKSTPAHHADTLLLRSDNVRFEEWKHWVEKQGTPDVIY
jgi:hypothetical protein